MITGSLVALVTPMQDNGALDWKRLHQLVEFHIKEGTDGIVAVGTTGESATLTLQEHCEVIKLVAKQVNGRVPVIAGTGSNSTQETILLTKQAKKNGADASLLITPYYNKPTQEGLYLHFKTIADAVSIPQILYNVSNRTAVDLLPETVAHLSRHKNIIGIKEASGILERSNKLRALCGEDFGIYSGDDATGMELMLHGANGVISVTNNIAPKLMHNMCLYAMTGDSEAAIEINTKLNVLHQNLFIETNPIPVKWALAEMGHIGHSIRLPLTKLSKTYRPILRDALQHVELI